MVWVEFDCPGHGKGPWDGLGAMVKTKVTLDITHGKERTMTGKITSPILVAQHLRATFYTNEWLMEHVDSRINEMVVMYLGAAEVIRPPAPPDVSVCKGIMSCFSFLFLGVPRHYAKRPFSCWCHACSRVRGRGLGSQSSGPDLLVSGCTRSNQTAWTEDQFTVTSSAGIRNREKRAADTVARELKRAKPGAWACIQAREVWSTEEEANMRPGQFWICKLGTVPGSMSCVEQKFDLQGSKCKWKEYKGTRYSHGDSALVVELWLHRVADDTSGLTFQEWDPSAGTDDTSAPVAMLVNSSELRAADFPLAEVRPLHLDAVARGGRRTRRVTVRKLQGVGNSTFVLSVENDNDFRSRCE